MANSTSTILSSTSSLINNNNSNANNMDKLAQGKFFKWKILVMPQLYSKIINNKKYEEEL